MVEDVALIRMTTVDMVEQLDFPVCEAADGPQALALLAQDGEIEILLTDLGLPGMDGRQLVEEALRLKPSLKVIIASRLFRPRRRTPSWRARRAISPSLLTWRSSSAGALESQPAA